MKRLAFLLIPLALLAVWHFWPQAERTETLFGSNSGALSAGTGADDASAGFDTWSNPSNITASDNSYATVSNGAGSTSHYLKGTNFGFSIPDGATIDGILVEIERSILTTAGAKSVTDSAIRIVKADGSIGTTNKSAGATWTTTDTYASYGGSSDLWGETWTAQNINDVDFGAVLAVVTAADVGTATAQVDHMRITVYYTEAAAASTIHAVEINGGSIKNNGGTEKK